MARLIDSLIAKDFDHIEALRDVVPADVFALDTPEAQRITKFYKSHGEWLSEIYEYHPNLRKPLRAVLAQLKEKK
jgi:hypothetical protein